MTASEVKEYFKEIRKEQQEVNHLAQMIRKEELELLPKAIAYDKDRVQTSPEDMLAIKASGIAEMEKELQRSIAILKAKRAKAESHLIMLDDADEREVMRYYYLDSLGSRLYKWDDICQVMNLSISSVFRIHGHALVNLTKFM